MYLQMPNVQSVLSNEGFPVLLNPNGGVGAPVPTHNSVGGAGMNPSTSPVGGIIASAAAEVAGMSPTVGSMPSTGPLTISSGPDIAALLRGVSPAAVGGLVGGGGMPQVNISGGGGMMSGGGRSLRGSGGSSGHVSVRDSVGSTGPIRNRNRIDTSPYGDRYSQSGYHHLSPPDPSWRRVHSDSSLHQSAGANAVPGGAGGGGGAGVAPPPGTPAQIVNHNGGVSPLRGASPTTARKGNHWQDRT